MNTRPNRSREAAQQCFDYFRKNNPVLESDLRDIIKAAIEKAYDEGYEECRRLWVRAEADWKSRAAHAGEQGARFAFRTRDGLIAVDNCPDVSDNAPHIMRWLGSKMPHARRYDRTVETHNGLPVYREYIEPPRAAQASEDPTAPA